MKNLLLLILLFSHQMSWCQQIYGSISGGHQIVVQNEENPSFLINTSHQISQPWFFRKDNVAFNSATNLDLSFGHQFKRNLGYELTASFIRPSNSVTTVNSVTRELSGVFFRINPRFVMGINLNKIQIYSKLGFIFGGGKIHYSQFLQDNVLKYEYSGGITYGFNGCIGMSIPVTKRIMFFMEIQAVSQSFSPKRGKTLANIIQGKDQEVYQYTPYDTEIEFGRTEELKLNPSDANQPQKLYKRNFSLSGYGITAGMKFILWNGKRVDSED